MECKNCHKETNNPNFCNRSCSASYNNKQRQVSSETKQKISEKLSNKRIYPIEEIIQKYSNGSSIKVLASEYHCHITKICEIVKGVEKQTRKRNKKSKKCLYCGKDTHNNKFCNRSCTAQYHNDKRDRYCHKHSQEKKKYNDGVYRCGQCTTDGVDKHRKETKLRAIEYKGGCCNNCGYDKCVAALEFHHLDPSQKDFAISSGHLSWEKVKTELDKCIMLCSNCHREVHYNEHLQKKNIL